MGSKIVQGYQHSRTGKPYGSEKFHFVSCEGVSTALPTLMLPSMMRGRGCGQIRLRRPRETGGLLFGIHWGIFQAAHEADCRGPHYRSWSRPTLLSIARWSLSAASVTAISMVAA